MRAGEKWLKYECIFEVYNNNNRLDVGGVREESQG